MTHATHKTRQQQTGQQATVAGQHHLALGHAGLHQGQKGGLLIHGA
jgi:hypothetical protein